MDRSNQKLFQAAEKGNVQKAKHLLSRKSDRIFAKDDKKRTALHVAIIHEQGDMVEFLVHQKFKLLTSKDRDGNTPMHLAAASGNSSILSILMREGAKLNQWNKKYETPLAIASKKGHLDIVNRLLENGARSYIISREETSPLMYAVNYNRTKVVRRLVDEGVDVNIGTCNGRNISPLNRASGNGNLAIVKILLEDDTLLEREDDFSNTCLNIAVKKGYKDIARKLLEKGAMADTENDEGNTPLHFATINEDIKMAKILLQEEEASILATNEFNETPYSLAKNDDFIKLYKDRLSKGLNMEC